MEAQRMSGMSIASMVCGIVGIVVSCLFWPVGIVLAIVAVILGILGLNEIKKQPEIGGRGMAITGIVLGGISLVLAILGIIGIAALAILGSQYG